MPVTTIQTRDDLDDHLAAADRTPVIVRTVRCMSPSVAPGLDSVACTTGIRVTESVPTAEFVDGIESLG